MPADLSLYSVEDGVENTYISSFIKKTRRGKVRKIVRELYYRYKMNCGLFGCKLCYLNLDKGDIWSPSYVVFPFSDVLLKHPDFFLQDESLTSVVLTYSVLENVGVIKRPLLNTLKNLVKNTNRGLNCVVFKDENEKVMESMEIDIGNINVTNFLNNEEYLTNPVNTNEKHERQYIAFPDSFFVETLSTDYFGTEKTARSLIKTIEWYLKHFKEASAQDTKLYLLCEDEEWFELFLNNFGNVDTCKVLSPYSFSELVSSKFPLAGEKLSIPNSQKVDGVIKSNSELSEYIYPSHLSEEEIIEGINKGEYFKGIIRFVSRSKGYVEVEAPSAQSELSLINPTGLEFNYRTISIEIVGYINLNRCIDGDYVVIKIEENNNAENKSMNLSLIKSQDALECESESKTEIPVTGGILLAEEDCIGDTELDIELDSLHLEGLVDSKKNSSIARDHYTGKVVGILKRNWKEYCGTLLPLNTDDNRYSICHNSSARQHRIFIPIDPKIPRIRIHTKMSSSLDYQRLIVVIDEWDRSSFYPSGHWVSTLGRAGDLETETSVILHCRNIPSAEFPNKVLRCLPNYGTNKEWEPREFDFLGRSDWRNKLVFSVDPPGCKDIDDALSIELIEGDDANGKLTPNDDIWYRVAVHIADVTHFVKPNTAIDEEASRRCTTCYLVNRRIDMFPGELTTDICSLVSNKDRLAFTCIWEINGLCKIRRSNFEKTIINSKHSYTYGQAQSIIDNLSNNSNEAVALRRLLNLSKILRKRRIDRGALELASSEVKIDLEEARTVKQNDIINVSIEIDNASAENCDKTSKIPNIKSVNMYQYLNTNSMVEEFMLLANITVAEFTLKHFPSCALLRKHPEPKYDQLDKLAQVIAKAGIHNFKYKTSAELAESLNHIKDDLNFKKNPMVNKLIRILTTRTMNQAVYFTTCKSNEGTYHYGLAENIYTHFTSPIRRYADIIVHRLLEASLGFSKLNEDISNKNKMLKLTQRLNKSMRNAQLAGRDSSKLFIYFYCKQHGKQIVEAMIMQVRNDFILVFVPEFGFEGSVNLDTGKFKYDFSVPQLVSTEDPTETLKLFDRVIVAVYTSDEYFQNKVILDLVSKK
ncbi:putative exosome complex exonuclease RRP44 [Cryptosporidium serpentis]